MRGPSKGMVVQVGLFDKFAAAVNGGTEEDFAEFRRKHKIAKRHGLTVAEYDTMIKQREALVAAAQNKLVQVAQARFLQLAQEQVGRRYVQYSDADVTVKVQSGYSRDHNEVTTDILIYHRDSAIREHLHIIFGEDGREIYQKWNANH